MPKRVSAKKEKNKPNKNGENGLPELNRNAAGIDVGNAEHYVAVPEGHDAQPVRKFGSFTADLHRMAQWLKACRIETVVMQATGVYWVALHQILEDYAFPSLRGKRTPHENVARTKDRCAGMPVATEAAHVRIVE